MDIFVKKYQPERYDLWRLGLEDTYEELNENNKRPYGDSFLISSNKKLPNNYSLETYLNKIYNSYLRINRKIDLNSTQLNHQLVIASDTAKSILTHNLRNTNNTNIDLVKYLISFDHSSHKSKVKSLKEQSSHYVNKLLNLNESDSENISIETLIKSESNDDKSQISLISFSNKIELQNQICKNGKNKILILILN